MGTTTDLWVVVEHAKGKLHPTSALLLQHAAALVAQAGRPLRVCAMLAAAAPDEEVTLLDALRRAGVAAATVLELAPGHHGEIPADAAEALLRDARPAVVLLPATPAPTRLAARLAAQRVLPLVADCVGLRAEPDGRIVFQVSTAGGMALVDTETASAGALVLMPQREFDGPVPPAGDAPLHVSRLRCEAAPSDGALELVSAAAITAEDMSLAEASVIVSGGRGLGQPEAFDMLRELASRIGGHVGASRVATDLGWIDRDHLVGMSGSTVRPALYLALGISGAPHHLMGMREATEIVALNSDPSAPIFQVATHAFVGDLHEIVPQVITRLYALRAGA